MKRRWPALLLVAFAATAQEEPTPFWMPPPPPAKKKAAPEKKKPKPKPARKPPAEAPTWIEPSPKRYESRPQKPPRAPAPAPLPVPVETPSAAPVETQRTPARPVAPAATQPLASPLPSPVRTPPPMAPAPPIAAPPIEEAPAPLIAQGEPEPEPESTRDTRNWSLDLVAGGWAKSRSDNSSRSWDLAYGLRAGYGLFDDQLELELQIVRAGGTSGSPFVNTTTTHDLAALRAFWVWGDRFALLLGGGGGIALAQTHYTLVDVISGTATGLDANAIKTVMEITAGARARVFRGLQARVEVSGILRDGRVEILPLFGLGWAL